MFGKHCYDYPRPAVTTDCVIYDFNDHKGLLILLIKRKADPYKNMWAFPGGFLDMGETAEECAKRELFEETGVNNILLEQIFTATKVDRDPRGRTISIVFFGKTDSSDPNLRAGDDAVDIGWFRTDELPQLAFDHAEILSIAKDIITAKHIKTI